MESRKIGSNRLAKTARHVVCVAALTAGLMALPNSAQADNTFCNQSVAPHSICPERVVGRFIQDYLIDVSPYRSGQIWLKDYIVRPFGLAEVVLSKTYYTYSNFTDRYNRCPGGKYYGWCYLEDLNGLDSNRVVCGAVGNRGDHPGTLGGIYRYGLAAKYNLDCDSAVSRFTGLPVYH